MADEPNPTLVTTPTTPTTPPAANEPAAREPDGSIKNVQATPPTTDQKSTTPDKSTTPETKPSEAPVVPEKYEFKAPEGFELDPKIVEAATPIFKELNLTQDQANKLFDFYSQNLAKGETKIIEQYETMRADWRKEIVGDKTLGNGKDGLSAEAQQNISAVISALPADIQTPFKDAMNLTGAGDNPAFIRAFAALGAAFREGTIVPGSKPSPLGQKSPTAGPKSAAQALYPNLNSSSAS